MTSLHNHLFLRPEVQDGFTRELIFWSPNTKHFPSELPSRMLDREDLYDYNPKDAWTLHWSKNKIPHLMFIPAHPTFEGPIFQRLACSLTDVPLECIDNFWYLRSDLRNQWERLEIALEVIITTLYGNRLFSLGYKHKWPSDFGYLKGFMDPKTARRCAIKSRDGFVELMGLCAHAIALHGPGWMDTLKENMRDYQPVWVENLAHSVAGDILNVPRVGVIVDPSRCEWLTWIPRLKKANVPIFFYWGHVNSKGYPIPCGVKAPCPDLRGPTQAEVAEFLKDIDSCIDWNLQHFGCEEFFDDLGDHEPEPVVELPPPPPPGSDLARLYARLPTPWSIRLSQYLPSELSASQQTQLPSLSTSPLASASPQLRVAPALATSALPANVSMSHFPKPKEFSRQGCGETWQEFFARQERRHQKYLAKESNEQRQSREGRETYARTSSLPSKRSTVFRWVPDEDTGFLMRERIWKGLVVNFWKNFSSTQRRFNAIDDEWDLCEEFDPAAAPESSDDDVDYYDSQPKPFTPVLETASNPSSTTLVAPSPRITPPDVFNADLLDIYRPELERKLLIPPLPLEYVLFQRYGYSPPCQYVAGQPIRSLTWNQARAILADSTNEASTESQGPILEFVSYLLNNPVDLCIPRSVSDLSASCSRYLRTHRPSVPYRRMQYQTQTSSNQARGTITTYAVLMGTSKGDFTRLLLIDKAATVLHILRKKWDSPSVAAIISYLLSSGTPFRMVALRLENPPSIPVPIPTIGLGTRDKDFQAGSVDYVAYEHARNALFSDETVLRAALQEGGILWRLAQDYLQGDLGVDCVLDGPSSFAHVGGHLFSLNNQYFVDDKLTDEQIGLICGLYKVRTESERYKNQVAEMSWWPKPNAWEKSGLNVGYWSADCETWYQRRLSTIRASRIELRSGAEWKQALRLQKKARELVHSYEQAAAIFLQGHRFL